MMLRKKIKGFTLVELMVAIVISSVLMLGVMQIFGVNKRNSNFSNGLARVQENGRFAMKKLTEDIRMAGYSGCSGLYANHLDQTHPDYSDDLFSVDNATGGWEYVGNGGTAPGNAAAYPMPAVIAVDGNAANWADSDGDTLPAELVARAIPGSDILVLKWAADVDNTVSFEFKNMNPSSESLNSTKATGVPAGTILAITDCTRGDIFQNTNNAKASALARGMGGSNTPGNVNPGKADWSHQYTNGATLMYFISRAYFIGVGASGEPALWRATFIQGNIAAGIEFEEVAEGIENMQVLFGEDINAVNDTSAADNDTPPTRIDRYTTAQTLGDHFNVAAVRVTLLARSPEQVKKIDPPNPIEYDLMGTKVEAPIDRRMRYPFTSTVKLRNRGFKNAS